jgi:hypothetical protein
VLSGKVGKQIPRGVYRQLRPTAQLDTLVSFPMSDGQGRVDNCLRLAAQGRMARRERRGRCWIPRGRSEEFLGWDPDEIVEGEPLELKKGIRFPVRMP